MIRITDDHLQGARLRSRYRDRRLRALQHQQELRMLGGEDGVRGRDLYLTWTPERQQAFWSWANQVQIEYPFAYVEEFAVAFPSAPTPERTQP